MVVFYITGIVLISAYIICKYIIVAFSRQSSMSSNATYLLDVTPSNLLPHPLSAPPALRVIQRFGCLATLPPASSF